MENYLIVNNASVVQRNRYDPHELVVLAAHFASVLGLEPNS
jgi:hypothetical protein